MTEDDLFRAYGVQPTTVTRLETVPAPQTAYLVPVGGRGLSAFQPAPAVDALVRWPAHRRLLGLARPTIARIPDGR